MISTPVGKRIQIDAEGWAMRRGLRTVRLDGVRLPNVSRAICAATLAAALAATLILLVLSSAVLADATIVRVDIEGGVVPLASTDIRMDSETVQAICYRNFAEYRVDFKFVNDGSSQTLELGFSSADITPPNEAVTPDALVLAQGGAPVALRAWQDGRPLKVTRGEGKDLVLSPAWVGYYLHTATFPHGETMITVSYLAATGDQYHNQYEYWLHTGAGWKGPIGKAIVRYRLADSFYDGGILTGPTLPGEHPDTYIAPDSYRKLDDRTYQWVFDNLEPTRDDDIFLISPMPNRLPEEFNSGGEAAVPAGAGAVAVPGAVSERRGPNAESSDPPGWEAIDGNPATAWGFSAESPDKWLQLGVQGNQNLREIRILPGRNDSPTSFKEYARPKTIDVNWGTGEKEITLKDEPSLQRFDISRKTDSVRLTIVDVYPGTKSNDVYLSEIDLGNAPAPEFDTFANTMAGGTPPTMEAVPAYETSTTSSVSTTSGLSTTSSNSAATTTAAPPATVGGPASPGGAGSDGSRELLWAVILVAVVAAAAIGVSMYLGAKLRGQARPKL
jgi:hypothetical protein